MIEEFRKLMDIVLDRYSHDDELKDAVIKLMDARTLELENQIKINQ